MVVLGAADREAGGIRAGSFKAAASAKQNKNVSVSFAQRRNGDACRCGGKEARNKSMVVVVWFGVVWWGSQVPAVARHWGQELAKLSPYQTAQSDGSMRN